MSQRTSLYQRVEELYQRALDLPRQDRAAFLSGECQGDVALRREVEELLSHYEVASDTFLAEPAHALSDSLETESLPERIGGFRILGRLGEGGMGVVYRAQQESPRREVALKVMRAGVTSATALRRFQLETAILGRLKHPGIAQIYEAGIHGDDAPRPFFVMELVDGPPLADFARTNQLNTHARLELVAAICDAVQYAHQRGLVHRDLKPGNILVVQQEADFEIQESPKTSTLRTSVPSCLRAYPKILDFGVALATDSDLAATTMHTDVRQVVGTLPYMSPEQLSGDVGGIDVRSDVYSLGVILYELLCGKVPFDVTGKTIASAARIIAEQEPAPPGAVDRTYRGDLDTIVLKALEKNSDRRYQSASDLAADLRRFLRHEPIAARPATAVYHFSKFVRRNRGLVAGLCAALVVLIAGLIGTSYGLSQAVRARDAEAEHRISAEQSEQAAVLARDEAEAVTRFLIETLGAVRPEAGGTGVTVREALASAVADVPEKFADRPLVEARLRHAIGVSFTGLGAFDDAKKQLTEAVAIFRRIKGETAKETIMSQNALVSVFSNQGQYGASEAKARAQLEIQRRVLGDENLNTWIAADELAIALAGQGRYDEAESIFRHFVEVQRRVRGAEHADTLAAENGWALVLAAQGRLTEAADRHRRILDIRMRDLGADHATTQSSLHNLANALNALGRYAEAESMHRQALEARKRIMGPRHFHTLMSLDDLARCLVDQGRPVEAESLAREALEGFKKVSGPDHPDTFEAMQNLAVAVQQQERFDEAESLLNAALEGSTRQLGEKHPLTLAALKRFAELRLATNKFDEAEQFARRCVEGRRGALGEHHPDTAHAMRVLARACLQLDQYTDAESLGRSAYDTLQKTLGANAAATKDVAALLRDVYRKLGRTTDAESWEARSL